MFELGGISGWVSGDIYEKMVFIMQRTPYDEIFTDTDPTFDGDGSLIISDETVCDDGMIVKTKLIAPKGYNDHKSSSYSPRITQIAYKDAIILSENHYTSVKDIIAMEAS